jgi:23S rRNA pseudouridine2605 synthase
MLERLHKTLARAGVAALRPAEDMIMAGRVTVNGRVVRELGARVDPDTDQIAVDGTIVEVPAPSDGRRYVMLHKPVGVISTAQDTHDRPTVVDLIPSDERLFPVGRLDADSEGLIVLTNDGDLAYRMTHPRFEVEKEYRVLLDRTPDVADLRRWREGVELDGDMTLPVWVELLDRMPDGTWVRIVMREGRNRQIRNVAGVLGYQVQRLIRVREGSLGLGDLEEGQWRDLTAAEVDALRAHVRHVPSPNVEQRGDGRASNDRTRDERTTGDRRPRPAFGERERGAADRRARPAFGERDAGEPRSRPASNEQEPSASERRPRPTSTQRDSHSSDRRPRPAFGERDRGANEQRTQPASRERDPGAGERRPRPASSERRADERPRAPLSERRTDDRPRSIRDVGRTGGDRRPAARSQDRRTDGPGRDRPSFGSRERNAGPSRERPSFGSRERTAGDRQRTGGPRSRNSNNAGSSEQRSGSSLRSGLGRSGQGPMRRPDDRTGRDRFSPRGGNDRSQGTRSDDRGPSTTRFDSRGSSAPRSPSRGPSAPRSGPDQRSTSPGSGPRTTRPDAPRSGPGRSGGSFGRVRDSQRGSSAGRPTRTDGPRSFRPGGRPTQPPRTTAPATTDRPSRPTRRVPGARRDDEE